MKDFTKFVCWGIVTVIIGIISFWYGLSEIYTQNGIQGFISLILWALSVKILNEASDRYNRGCS
jgi:spore maturation protein SpmA